MKNNHVDSNYRCHTGEAADPNTVNCDNSKTNPLDYTDGGYAFAKGATQKTPTVVEAKNGWNHVD